MPDAKTRMAATRAAYEAHPVAKRIGGVMLPTFGGYTAAQAIGPSGCLAIAYALTVQTSGYASLIAEPSPAIRRRNAAEEDWAKVWGRVDG